MPKRDLSDFFKNQISLTEWFEKTDHQKTEAFREEEATRNDRLQILNKFIELPTDTPTRFEAFELVSQTENFKNFLKEHGAEVCALRLIPHNHKLPKLRIRGMSIRNVLDWFDQQKINPKDYRADFIPHSDNQKWATIFIINNKGIFGEIIKGGHYQLTQGVHDEGDLINFSFNFSSWQFSKKNQPAERFIKDVVKRIRVTNKKLRQQLKKLLDVEFVKNYIKGYFEALVTTEYGLWFIDYNRLLGELYENFSVPEKKIDLGDYLLAGQTGYPGQITGKVKVILDKIDGEILQEDEILVCPVTTPAHLPLMRQALAIITDQGGILSHAAIIARELGKPCITATKNATTILKNGQIIEVDANLGIVRRI